MQVFLLQTVSKLGKAGELVNVKDGFARNFLIPRGHATPVTQGTQKQIEQQKKNLSLSLSREEKKAEELKIKIETVDLSISVKTGKNDKIYGAITNQLIQKHLKTKGIILDKKIIQLTEPIHKLGQYSIPVKLSSKIEASLKLTVVKS